MHQKSCFPIIDCGSYRNHVGCPNFSRTNRPSSVRRISVDRHCRKSQFLSRVIFGNRLFGYTRCPQTRHPSNRFPFSSAFPGSPVSTISFRSFLHMTHVRHIIDVYRRTLINCISRYRRGCPAIQRFGIWISTNHLFTDILR